MTALVASALPAPEVAGTSRFGPPGYRWPADVILIAVRWYLRHPLSGTSVMELLAERGIDVSNRTVLRWAQAFGPQLAPEAQAPSTARSPLVHRRDVLLSR